MRGRALRRGFPRAVTGLLVAGLLGPATPRGGSAGEGPGDGAAARGPELVLRVEPDSVRARRIAPGEPTADAVRLRHDPEVIATFSRREKRRLQALFPRGKFRLLRAAAGGLPDEFLATSGGFVLARDDLFVTPAGSDGAVAMAFFLRPPGSRVVADDGPPLSPVVTGGGPVGGGPGPGVLEFAVVKDLASGGAAVLYRRPDPRRFARGDLLRARAFPLGGGRGFGYVSRDDAEGAGGPEIRYDLFSRGPVGIHLAWSGALRSPGDPASPRRCELIADSAGDPVLLVGAAPAATADPRRLAPAPGGAAGGISRRGLAEMFRLRGGVFRAAGLADRARGDRPLALRETGPDYRAYAARGPSALFSFGVPGSPFEEYRCPWPDRPADLVPWVDSANVFKGAEHRRGAADVRMANWFLHDDAALYFVAVVRDDRLVLTAEPGAEDTGDHLQLWLAPGTGGEGLGLRLFPGSPPGVEPRAAVLSPTAKAGAAPGVRVAARPQQGGYWLEVAVPFAALAALGYPAEGSLWGAVANVVDVDDPGRPGDRTVLSTSRDFRWAAPETMNNLILE